MSGGTGQSCAADGTIGYIREEYLISEYHIRYGHRGGIAYHHVSDQYIALFYTFIPCGVWEAVEIIEALLKNQSEINLILSMQIRRDNQLLYLHWLIYLALNLCPE